MLFYWILFILALILAVVDRRKTYWYLFGILFFLAITRGENVGADLKGIYRAEFFTIGWNPKTWGISMKQNEIGFNFIIAFFKTFISDYFLVCFNCILGVTLILYSKFLYKYSKNPSLSLFFMLAFAYYFECYNGMRQQFCDSILISYVPLLLLLDKNRNKSIKTNMLMTLYCINRIKNLHISSFNNSKNEINNMRLFVQFMYKRMQGTMSRIKHLQLLLLYCLLVIITSFLFHKSQMIFVLLIPILYLYNTKVCDTKYLLLYLLIAMLLSIPIAQIVQKYFAMTSILFQEDNSNIGGYLAYDAEFGEYSQLSNYLNTLFCMYVVFTHRYKRSFFLCLYVFGVILLDTLTPIFWIFQRIAFVFMFFRVIVYAEMVCDIPNKIERNTFSIAVLIYSIILYNRRLINDNFQDVVPYESFLF